MNLFRNRKAAGEELASQLAAYLCAEDGPFCVIALARGGVPVACEIAKRLHAPLDVLVVRKLGIPSHPELAFGALATGNVRVLDYTSIDDWSIAEEIVDALTASAAAEITRRERLYQRVCAPVDVRGHTVILVDDGIATGATILAAIKALVRRNPERLIVAVPVAPAQSCEHVRARVDEVICLQEPQWFDAVGAWYKDFAEVGDAEVCALLNEAQRALAPEAAQ